MTVTSLARFAGGNREALIANCRRAKAIHEKAGAEYFRVGQIYTGPHAGEWLVAVRWADWAAYGKAQQTLASDSAYQQLWADVVTSGSRLVDRVVVAGIDL